MRQFVVSRKPVLLEPQHFAENASKPLTVKSHIFNSLELVIRLQASRARRRNIDCAFQTKGDEMNSTQRVVENHIQRFREGDLEGVLEDFSPKAVVFTPSGTLKGKTEIKTLFRNLLEEFGKPAASETVRTAIFEGDYAYLIWSGETVDNNYEFATDTFVVRNGKIVMQSFAAKVTPKR